MTQADLATPATTTAPFRRPDQTARTGMNVGETERLVSGAAGAFLALAGLSRRSAGGLLLAGIGGALLHRAATGHCHAYAALGIDTAHSDGEGAAPEEYFDHGIHVRHTLTINKPPHELFDFWRRLENLSQIFNHLESVTENDATRSHWVARGPLDMKYEWDAEIINQERPTVLAWRSLGGADVDNAGSVRFLEAAGGRGTELKVTIDYIPTAGVVGKALATMIGEDPEQQICSDLRAFKRFMETGERPSTEGQPQGSCADR